eukprot:scaffold225471_cov48-Attheya_sp.AAC.5
MSARELFHGVKKGQASRSIFKLCKAQVFLGLCVWFECPHLPYPLYSSAHWPRPAIVIVILVAISVVMCRCSPFGTFVAPAKPGYPVPATGAIQPTVRGDERCCAPHTYMVLAGS